MNAESTFAHIDAERIPPSTYERFLANRMLTVNVAPRSRLCSLTRTYPRYLELQAEKDVKKIAVYAADYHDSAWACHEHELLPQASGSKTRSAAVAVARKEGWPRL